MSIPTISQFGPYDFFNYDSTNKQIQINVDGSLKRVKQIYINDNNTLRQVKKVIVNKTDIYNSGLACSYDLNTSLTFELNNNTAAGITKPTGTVAPCFYSTSYLYYFTCGGNRVYLPIGWTGKISFWQASSIAGLGKPSNTPNTTANSWFQNSSISSGNTQAYYKNSSAITGTTQRVLAGIVGGFARSIPVDGVIADWASTTAAPSSIVNSKHETSHIQADGTFFSFNKYHLFTALQDNIYGIILNWAGANCNALTYAENNLGKLRMCVTTTSTIQPIIGTNGMLPANSGLI